MSGWRFGRFSAAPRAGARPESGWASVLTQNSHVLYVALFVSFALAVTVVSLAIMPEKSRKRAPVSAAQVAHGRSRRAVVSRQKSGNEEAPLLCLYDRNTERGKNPTPYQLLKHLPASFCTHLVYGFVSPVDLNGGPSPAHPSQAGPIKDAERRIGQMVALKKSHPTLRVLLGVGGPKVDSQSFSDQLSTEGQRDRFAKRSVRWLQARRLDGMHVQWMYPGEGNGRPTDRQNFPKLLSQLRRAFKSQSGSRWHLTLYLPHDHTQIDRGYELRNAVNSVHYAVFAAFGFSEPGLAEVTSPLYNQPPTVEGVSPVNSIHELVLLLLDRGAPSNKLLLGLSATGLSYTLARGQDGVRAQLREGDGRGRPGPFSATPGQLAYFEICYNVYRNGWARVFNAGTSCPYAFKGRQWVSYDDADSVRAKVAFVRNRTLAGVALVDVAADDYMGMCGPKNVLARTIRSAMGHYASPSDGHAKRSPKTSRQVKRRQRAWIRQFG
ncbi:hypothetical protein HPB48_000056 [Haemaphysalis longicornis]|uniref:GH18 domain-containing protein n=1 Tax=Haemaphysalis longicornis TaxID=44386 RepID=A0A9J6FY87_HAELO|nr:hypothetical protein HPB48_000056 [Haemaphysalis longicornis]